MTLQQPDSAELLEQGPTFRCAPFSVLSWFSAGNGGSTYPFLSTTAWQRYIGLADIQHGSSFGNALGLVVDMAAELRIRVRLLGDGFLRDFATHDQAIRDGWCVVDGIYEGDVQDPAENLPLQDYFHFVAVDDLIALPPSNIAVYSVKDPFHIYDGEDGVVAVADFQRGIAHNWDEAIIGVAFRFD